MIAEAVRADGDVLMFAHGHILRVVLARWIGDAGFGRERLFKLDPARISILGHEHDFRVLDRWNAPAG